MAKAIPFTTPAAPAESEPLSDEEVRLLKHLLTTRTTLLYAVATEVKILAARAGDDEAVARITDLLTDTKESELKLGT
jgi:hypothetical protein